MQLCLSFRADSVNLPIAYRSIQHGLIYHTLSEDADFATQLHNNGHQTEDRSYKHFTFSPFCGDYSISNKRIVFQQELSMEIRSSDPRFILTLSESLTEGKTVQLGSQNAVISHSAVSDRHVLQPEVDIQTISPLVVYQTLDDGHTVFLSPTEETFLNSLVHNAQRKWRSSGGTDADFRLSVTPLPNQQFRKVPTAFKTTFITGWQGRFHLSGNPQVIDMLYQIGLGAKSSQGFGMFLVL